MNQRERQRAETHDRILEAALGRFDDVGRNFTLDEIARAAGVTRMTIHRHIGGREQLLNELVLREGIRLMDEVRPILDAHAGFGERIVDAMTHMVQLIRGSGPLMTIFNAQAVTEVWPEVDPTLEIAAAAADFFLPYFEEAARFGILRADARTCNEWVLNQVLCCLVVPAIAQDEESVRFMFSTFVVPAIIKQ